MAGRDARRRATFSGVSPPARMTGVFDATAASESQSPRLPRPRLPSSRHIVDSCASRMTLSSLSTARITGNRFDRSSSRRAAVQLDDVESRAGGYRFDLCGALAFEDADEERPLGRQQALQAGWRIAKDDSRSSWHALALLERFAIWRAVSGDTRRGLSAKTRPMKSAPASRAASASSTVRQPQILT